MGSDPMEISTKEVDMNSERESDTVQNGKQVVESSENYEQKKSGS